MSLKTIGLILILFVNRFDCALMSKYMYIGDCIWNKSDDNNGELIFICYDHYHKDRFFNYNNDKKPCINDQEGYRKDWVGKIRFQNCQLLKIPFDIIEYYRYVFELNISDIGLTTLSETDFNGNHGQKLRTILASHNSLVNIKGNLLKNARHINAIDFSSNKINHIDPSAFGDASELLALDISNNKLNKIEAGTFQNLHKLKELHLHHNNMNNIEEMTFLGLTSLEKIDLSYNNITKLNVPAFEDISPKCLNVSHNKISEIDLTIFIALSELKTIDLSHNHIRNMSKSLVNMNTTTVLTELFISHNQIESIEQISVANFSELINLDMSYNRISSLNASAFVNFVNLTYINLSHNPIKILISKTFSSSNLQYLNLSYTNLSDIESGTFLKPHKLQIIDLSHNQFKTFDFNVFLPRLNDLRSLNLDGNKLLDLDGFRRPLFPNLNNFHIQDNSFNCSYLQYFFESIVWHTLNINLDRNGIIHSVNVGGIRCNKSNEISILSTDSTWTTSNELTSTMNKETIISTTTEPEKATRQTDSCENASSRLEMLLSVLCFILMTFLIVHLIINKDRIRSQFRCTRYLDRQNRLPSTTTINTESIVTYSTK